MSLMRVTATDYTVEDDKVIVQLAGRGADGRRRTHLVHGTEPWLFVPEREDVPDQPYIQRVERGYESYDGAAAKKVVTQTPRQAGGLTDAFTQTWESDIPYYRRVSMADGLTGYIDAPSKNDLHIDEIDVDVTPDEPIEPRILIGDIEVLPNRDVPFEEMVEEAAQPIIDITVYDTYSEEYTIFVLNPDEYEFGVGRIADVLKGHWDGDTNGSINVEICEDEPTLLRRFIEYVSGVRPDLISGWNWVDFDHRYLIDRMRKVEEEADKPLYIHDLSDLGTVSGWAVERSIDCLPAFDMMDAMKKMTYGDRRSWALDYVASDELDVGKMPSVNIEQDYKRDRERLAAYNIVDVQLCVMLDEKNDIHEFFYELAEMSGIQIYDTFSEMRLVDGFIMSRRGPNELLPAAEEKDLDENAGGLVLDPYDGIQDWVGVFDLKSLYPSSIITWNISTETLVVNDADDPVLFKQSEADTIVPRMPDPDDVDGRITEDDIGWDRMGTSLATEGIIPKYLRRLFKERAARKDRRNQHPQGSEAWEVWDRKQAAVKVIMNSFYGVSSNDYWRLAREGMGDAITSAARYTLWKGADIARSEGYEVLYGDTDSVFIPLNGDGADGDETVEFGESLEGVLNRRMEQVAERIGVPREHPYLAGRELHGTDRQCLVWEFEKLYRRYLQAGKKKRYAGLKVWAEGEWLDDPSADLTGFETQRSDAPLITEEFMTEVTRRVLDGQSFEAVSEYVQEVIDDIENERVELHRVARPGVLKHRIEDYDSETLAVRACKYSNEHLGYEWLAGDSPWLYYVDESPPMKRTDIIALDWNDDMPQGYSLDVGTIVEKALEAPVDPILGVADFDFTELRTGGQTGDALGGDWGVAADDVSGGGGGDEVAEEATVDNQPGSGPGGALEW